MTLLFSTLFCAPQIPKFSQLFHRDNNQMDLRDLQPGHSYTVDLVFITHENQTTKVTNTMPITFSTLPEEGEPMPLCRDVDCF